MTRPILTPRFALLVVPIALLFAVSASCSKPTEDESTPRTTSQASASQSDAPQPSTSQSDAPRPCASELDMGTVIVYSDMLNPPFSSWDAENRAVGMEVDLLGDAARRLGRDIEWIEKPFRELLPGVVDGSAHIAASTIGIRPDRARIVAFSRPYYQTEIVALVRAGKSQPKTLDDLAALRIGAGRSTTSESAVKRKFPSATLIVEVVADSSMREMLEQGVIDAYVLDAPAALRTLAENAEARRATNASEITAPELRRLDAALDVESYGFAVALGADELLAAINAAIEATKDSAIDDAIDETAGTRR